MRQIYVIDQSMHRHHHYGYWLVIVLLLALAGFSTSIAWRNAKPICNDLRAVTTETSRTLECVYDLGDKQEDSVDVLIRH